MPPGELCAGVQPCPSLVPKPRGCDHRAAGAKTWGRKWEAEGAIPDKSVCSQAAPRAIFTDKQHSSHSQAGAVSSAVSFTGNYPAAVRPKSSSPFKHKHRRDSQRLHSSQPSNLQRPPGLSHLPLLCMECRKMGLDRHCPWVSTAWPGALPPGAT